MNRTFVGFGFGAIQAGLFIYEAHRSGNFDRLVVSEIMPDTVNAVRDSNGCYRVNIAADSGVETHEVSGLEVLNPTVPEDLDSLIETVSCADEIATALPSVKHYNTGGRGGVANILAEGFGRRFARGDSRHSIVYAAENDNCAAEILEHEVNRQIGGVTARAKEQVQYLNTVIGKMSGVVTDEEQICEQRLARMAGNSGKCFLVESFNRIFISRVSSPEFIRGIVAFEEKDDLLPFEEAKLYGHNATHALIGYMARDKGLTSISDISMDKSLQKLAREAFVEESGKALCRRHSGVDPLFTAEGYQSYADDLMERMMNPHLRDMVDRVVRDPRRKLGWNDRLVGVMRVAMEQGITPVRYALGARSALNMIVEQEGADASAVLKEIWSDSNAENDEKETIKQLILLPCFSASAIRK